MTRLLSEKTGRTHEPIEQLASVRCMPGVQAIRPADGNETRAAGSSDGQTDAPTILCIESSKPSHSRLLQKK